MTMKKKKTEKVKQRMGARKKSIKKTKDQGENLA